MGFIFFSIAVVEKRIEKLKEDFISSKNFRFMFCLPVWICTACMPGIHRGQKRALGSLELELLLGFERHPVGAGN